MFPPHGIVGRNLEALLEGSGAVVWEAEPATLRASFVGPGAVELLGYPVERWLAARDVLALVLPAAERDQALSVLRAVAADRISRSWEHRVVTASGRTLWCRTRVQPLLSEDGAVRALAGLMLDVTDRKRTEGALQQALREEQELRGAVAVLTEALEAVDEGIVVEREGRMLAFNQRFIDMWRLPEAVLAAHDYRRAEAVMLDQMAAPDTFRTRTQEPRLQTQSREEVELKDGRIIECLWRLPRTEARGHFRLWSFRDMTAQLRTEEQRRCAEEERDQLLSEEQASRRLAEDARTRSEFLAEASHLLAGSLDYEATLSQVARLAVPTLADWCAVDLVAPDGSIQRVAVAHADPAKEQIARELRRYPPDPSAPEGVPRVVRTGQPVLCAGITDTELEGGPEDWSPVVGTRDEEHLRLLRRMGTSAYMSVPLQARGRTLGALTFVLGRLGQRYGAAELALAEDLAGRAALAVDNARLYREAQEALEALRVR